MPMHRSRLAAASVAVIVAALLSAAPLSAWGQTRKADPAAQAAPAPTEPPPPVYEEQLLRLAEILGSLHFLRGLCGDGDAGSWRTEMDALLTSEAPGPVRRTRLVGRFNHGFETFNATYRSCTPSARLSIRRYLVEGKAVAADVRARYGQ